MSNRPFLRTPPPPNPPPSTLSAWDIFLHTLFQVLLLANCILILIALFSRAPIAAFAIFLIWTVIFYLCIFLLAWHGQPETSILSIAIHRLRVHPMSPVPQADPSVPEEPQSPVGSPYTYQQPSWRRAVSPEDDRGTRTSYGRPTLDLDYVDDDDDDDDETERQRRMEEELERRDVHIITVPRKRLWIANPS